MRCDEFEVRLNEVLDQRRSPGGDPQLRDHAQACPDCQEQLAAMGQLLDGLDLLEVPPLADDFALRVVSRVVPAAPNHPQRSWWLPWAVAVAAVLLLSLLPGYWFLRPLISPAQPRGHNAEATRQWSLTPALRPLTASTEWSPTFPVDGLR